MMDIFTNTKPSQSISITFGDVSENHVGNQKNGKLSLKGYSIEDLEFLKNKFEEKQIKCELIRLDEVVEKDLGAGILIIRDGLKYFDINHDELFNELVQLDWDKKYLCRRRGKVLNKHARYNLCFSNESQEPNYSEGEGRIYSFDDLKNLNKLRNDLGDFGDEFKELEAEGNLYFSKKCYIGYHLDNERAKVYCCRVGSNMNLYFNWFYNKEKKFEEFKFLINGGDMYVLTETAKGKDSRKKNTFYLKHAANFDKL